MDSVPTYARPVVRDHGTLNCLTQSTAFDISRGMLQLAALSIGTPSNPVSHPVNPVTNPVDPGGVLPAEAAGSAGGTLTDTGGVGGVSDGGGTGVNLGAGTGGSAGGAGSSPAGDVVAATGAGGAGGRLPFTGAAPAVVSFIGAAMALTGGYLRYQAKRLPTRA